VLGRNLKEGVRKIRPGGEHRFFFLEAIIKVTRRGKRTSKREGNRWTFCRMTHIICNLRRFEKIMDIISRDEVVSVRGVGSRRTRY